jgi:hypothetical protein
MRLRFRDKNTKELVPPQPFAARRGRSLLYMVVLPPPTASSVGVPLQGSPSTIDPFLAFDNLVLHDART